MSAPELLGWRWRPTATAPEPRAAVCHGAAVPQLFARLRGLPSQRRERLSATAAPEWLVVLGPADALPWTDGVRYAAPHPLAPALWLPTHLEPDAPIDLIWQALERRHARTPLLLWPEPMAVLPLDRPRAASDELLATLDATWRTASAGAAGSAR